MKTGNLHRWLHRESRRDFRRVTLEDVLVFGQFRQYLWQRSKRFALTRSAQELLHVGELYLLFLYAPQDVFIAAAIVTIGIRIAGSAWWGGLELLRGGVRLRCRDGRYSTIGPWIRLWLIGTTALACCVCLAGAGYAVEKSLTAKLGVAEVYIAARVICFGLELPVRTFHSGAYALRRIYQPMWALLAPSVLRGLVLLSLWSPLGLWTIPAALFCSVLTGVFLTAWFTRLAYIDLGIWPLMPDPRRRRVPASFRLPDANRFAVAALANACTGIGHLWALALLSFGTSDPELWLALFVYLVLAAPLFEACLAWARLFYPDLAKLEDDLLFSFRLRLEQNLIRWAPIVGTFAWLPTLAVMPLLPYDRVEMVAVLTWIFFVVRARFAAIQIIAFCRRRYGALLLASLGLGVAAGTTHFLPGDAQLFWLMGAVLVCEIPFRLKPSRLAAPQGIVPLASLLAEAPRIGGEGTWVLSEFRPGCLLHGAQVLLQRIARQAGPIGIDRGHLLLRWEPAVLTRRKDFDMTHGFEGRRWQSATGSALDGLRSWLGRWPGGPLPVACTFEEVIDEFRSRFPDEFWVRAGDVASEEIRLLLTWRERERVLHEAVLQAFGRPPGTLLPLDVSALVSGGRIAAIFFLKRDTPPAARRNWRRWLRQIAVANALAAAGSLPLENRHANFGAAPADLPTRRRETCSPPSTALRGSSASGTQVAGTDGCVNG